MTRFLWLLATVGVFVAVECRGAGVDGDSRNLLKNPSFAEGVGANGLPKAWSLYGGADENRQVTFIEPAGSSGPMVQIADGDATAEIGLYQSVPVEPGSAYQARVQVRAVSGHSSEGSHIQLRFLPSNHYGQVSLTTHDTDRFTEVVVGAVAPAGTTHATVYLYTHRDPTPRLLLRNVSLVSAPAPPAPVPPVYEKLKDLHLITHLVRDGRPNATIVTSASGLYDAAAERIRQAIKELAGAELPSVGDETTAAAVPIVGNLIVLGNRSTNRTISELYNRYYTLLDLRYPGPGGSVIRSLHNPFGDGRNVIFIGGSDVPGVDKAADTFVTTLQAAKVSKGSLSVGRLAKIQLGKGIRVPTDLRAFETWEASKGYGSVGYFGWNSLSKRLAMFYMTGDEFHAREFVRLAFPDEKAKREIADIDGERIENKDEPLSGPYHYNAHMMALFWDLVEESPVFTDDERLRVTNAFAKQLNHRRGEGIYGRINPPVAVGSRHGQWSAISLYCLGRYLQRGYPCPLWQHCMDSARLHFQPLHRYAWVGGESDNLFWYNTGIAPIFTYLLLTGDREPLVNGVLVELLRGQEMLISGRLPDWALGSASIGYLHKAAYLTQDGRWLEYRRRSGVDTSIFRLGQSFWPETLKPQTPTDTVGTWNIHSLPKPMWQARRNGLPLQESFQFGSFRSAADASGDFILIDGYNGASRNPYHTFAVLELRLKGHTLLQGYRNQLLTRADGLVEPQIAMNAALKYHDTVGGTATVVGEVSDAAYCGWRRTLAQRIGRYALVVDDLSFRTDAGSMDVEILWETGHSARTLPDGHIEFSATTEVPERRTVRGGQVHSADPVQTTRQGRVTTMLWSGPVKRDGRRVFFSLVGIEPDAAKASLRCLRAGETAALLNLPEPALAVVDQFANVTAELAVLAGSHLYGKGMRTVNVPSPTGDSTLISAASPVDVGWDHVTGVLHVVASEPTSLQLGLTSGGAVQVDGQKRNLVRQDDGLFQINLSPGRHAIEGAQPPAAVLATLDTWLSELLTESLQQREQTLADANADTTASLAPLNATLSAEVGDSVTDMAVIAADADTCVYVAAGKTVHVLSPTGDLLQTLTADGAVRMVRWWSEHELLLVGCADEQVIAFDRDGNRRWVFTSQMDPAVYRAAKTYWFKSAPGHEGIHGLFTGTFLNGKSQAFVGSACTLEILDETGQLIQRMPQFWGKVSHFAMIDGPDKTLNLLASRRYNGTNHVAIINNKTLNPNPRGFLSVPPGATYVGGWSAMNRHHLFYEDMDGDGTNEVISEINGNWNRVTVWSATGKALHDASFGPGDRIPAKNMRDLDIADLDGDGKKEIVTATARGLVVALDNKCNKLWATRLPSPPTVMKCAALEGEARSWIVVGCENGSVLALDGKGNPVRSAAINGWPTCVDVLRLSNARPMVLIASDKGEVRGFAAAAAE